MWLDRIDGINVLTCIFDAPIAMWGNRRLLRDGGQVDRCPNEEDGTAALFWRGMGKGYRGDVDGDECGCIWVG